MATQLTHPPAFAKPELARFRRVIAGIDGSRADGIVTAQAARLLEPDGTLELVSISSERGRGATAQAALSRTHAVHALREADEVARDLGVEPVVRQLAATNDTQAMLSAAHGHDLLVVGFHGGRRFGGIMLGSTATAAAHSAPCPVLIARPVPDGFPRAVLLAHDGSPASDLAAGACAAIARRFGSDVTIAMLNGHARSPQAADLTDWLVATGVVEPTLIDDDAPAHRAIPRLAGDVGADLVIVGTHGRHGLRALGSVAERVAHAARCSVLVVRPQKA